MKLIKKTFALEFYSEKSAIVSNIVKLFKSSL